MRTMHSNFITAWRHFSSWVVVTVTGAAAYWLQLPLAQQREVLDLFPQIKWLAPLLAIVLFFFAKSIVQYKPEELEALAKAEAEAESKAANDDKATVTPEP